MFIDRISENTSNKKNTISMKKIILLCLSLIVVVFLQGQSIEKEFNNAKNLLKQRKYKDAIHEVNSVIALIENEQLNTMIENLLPDNVLDYTRTQQIQDIEARSKSYISGNRIVIMQTYSKPISNIAPTSGFIEGGMERRLSFITISISNLPDSFCEIANAYSMNSSENLSMEAMKSILFNGYRAVNMFNAESQYGRFAVIIGGAVLEISAQNIENGEIIIDIANSISFEKIS